MATKPPTSICLYIYIYIASIAMGENPSKSSRTEKKPAPKNGRAACGTVGSIPADLHGLAHVSCRAMSEKPDFKGMIWMSSDDL